MFTGGMDDLKVAVVGAGAAGLGAALRLKAARVSFIVLGHVDSFHPEPSGRNA